MHPPNPEAQSQREGGNPALANCKPGSFEHPQNILPARQAQHLRRLYALTASVANAIAELAFAGLPR